jgi:hypothetical protein
MQTANIHVCHEERSASISCFFPAFNDGASVGKVVADALAVLPELTSDYEVIVVDGRQH